MFFLVDDLPNFRADDFHKNGAKIRVFLVLAAGDHSVQLFKWDLIHHLVHVLLGGGELIVFKFVFFMLLHDEILQFAHISGA